MPSDITYARTISAFPNEIQDRILDFLHNSRSALKACALVCRAWVPTSRYHLFSEIVLNQNTVHFEELIQNPNCTIRSCVHLMGSHTAATATLNALRNLTPSSLHLRRWLFSDLLIGPFSSVECLKLDYVDFGYSQGVVDIFATFPNVRELSMTSCSRLVQSRECVYVSCPPPLRSLEFAYCKMDPLLHDFIRGRIVPTNVFSIHRLRYDDIPVVGEYFSMFGNVLQEIRIGFSYDRHDVLEGFCASARLHCLTGFQRLSLDTRFYGPGFSDLHIKLLASILNIIPSSTLKKLVLEIPTPPIEPRFAGWRQIGEVLQQPRFSQLTELVFIPTTEPYEHFERWIREDLRALEERGILSCPRWLT